MHATGKWLPRSRKIWKHPQLMRGRLPTTRKASPTNGKTKLRPMTNSPETRILVATVARPNTQGLSALPVTKTATNVERKATMGLFVDLKRLVAMEVKTGVVLNQEVLEQNNLKKAVYGPDESLQGSLGKIAAGRGQDLPTCQRSDVAGWSHAEPRTTQNLRP